MFRKVLFPTDFSEGAYRAVEVFEKRNKMEVGEVILLHVIDEGTLEELMDGYSFFYDNAEIELKDIKEKLKEEASRKLQEKAEEVKRAFRAKNVRTIIRFGIPWDEIVKVAEEENDFLIILPSRCKLSLSHEFLGSTVMRVLRKTKKPVLIIKEVDENELAKTKGTSG